MKKNLFLLMMFISSLGYSQVVLKGFNLGGYSDDNEKVTTVGGLPGVISLDKMKNGKIWKITFSSTMSFRSEENKFEEVEFYNELRALVNGIEENYLVKFDKDLSLENIIEVRDIKMNTLKNGVEFVIQTHYERRNYKEWITFSLRSIRLDQINRNENPDKHDY